MAQSTRHPEHSSDKYSVKDEKDHYPKERHRDHRHRDDRSRPSREHRKYPDHDSRSTQDGDHSKPKHNRDREKRREREKRHDDRNAHPREDRHRSERDYREREHREREHHRRDDHYNKPEREHHSQTYSRSADDNHQHYKNEKRVPFPDDHVSHRNDRSIATVPVEYIEAEDHTTPSEMHYFEPDYSEGILNFFKCRYLCTSRGIIQLVEVLLNLLVLVCVVASYVVISGYSSNSGLATSFFSINSDFSPIEGEELKEIQKLDQQFAFLRAPVLYGGIAVSIGMFVITTGVMIRGARLLRIRSLKWLIFEFLFNVLASVGYGVSVGLYLYFVLQINSTDLCKTRERIYARHGLSWMNCDVSGTDGAVVFFGILISVFYCVSVVLAVLCYRKARLHKNTQTGT
ncbi:MARVEL domain-containing protein 3 isoform X2 [Callorhinchus milii]|uniref:MARVEL domain-containing protein 3 isoform X2 n=1 Tax=Callorhinchus milii TaxID=7868 RepID=UPI001C3F7069|nr:MARVEL domain-containing protein 3 isoform X2 [Callorhinchus milii]